MPNYLRVFIPGGCWFFTVNLRDRRSELLVENIDLLREAVRDARRRYPFEIEAMVVLPDHLHAIWTLPPGDSNFPQRWRWIKRQFSRGIEPGEWLGTSRLNRGERGIWQRRYWEHGITGDREFRAYVDYCYFNPVKHGLVARVEDWPYSSFHRDMKGSTFSVDPSAFRDRAFGERD